MLKRKWFAISLFRKKLFFSYAFWLIVLFLLLRFCFIFFSPYAVMSEESKQSILGIDLIEGIHLPIECYMEAPHAGGKLTDGILVIPFLLLFGFNLFAGKMLALFFSLATVYVLYKWFDEFYGKAYAFIFLSLVCLAPPHFIQQNTAIFGNLIEPMFFISLCLYFFCKIAFTETNRVRNYFFLGVISGFGIWVQYGVAPVIAVLFLYLMIYVKNVRLKQVGILFAGFVIGLFPLLLYRLEITQGYDYYILGMDHNFFLVDPMLLDALEELSCFVIDILTKVPFLLFVNIPFSFHFSDIILDEYWFAHTYSLIFFFSLLGLFIKPVGHLFLRIRQEKSLFVSIDRTYFIKQTVVPVIFLCVVLAFCMKSGNFIDSGDLVYSGHFFKSLMYDKSPDYQFGKMDHHYGHYEVFFHLFMIVIIALLLGNLVVSRKRYRRLITYVLTGVLLIMGGCGYVGLYLPKPINNSKMLFHYSIKQAERTDIVINEYVSFGYRYKLFLYDMSRVYDYPVAFQTYFLERIAKYLSLEIKKQKVKEFDPNQKTFPSLLDKSVSTDNLIYWLREEVLPYEYLKGRLNKLSIVDRRYFITMLGRYLKQENVPPTTVARVMAILTQKKN